MAALDSALPEYSKCSSLDEILAVDVEAALVAIAIARRLAADGQLPFIGQLLDVGQLLFGKQLLLICEQQHLAIQAILLQLKCGLP